MSDDSRDIPSQAGMVGRYDITHCTGTDSAINGRFFLESRFTHDPEHLRNAMPSASALFVKLGSSS